MTVKSTPPRGSESVGARHRSGRRRQRDRLCAGRRARAAVKSRATARSSGAREQNVGGRPFDQRHRLSVEARISHPEPGGNRHFHPAVTQHIDRQQDAPGDGSTVMRAARSRCASASHRPAARVGTVGSGFARARSARYSSTGRTTQPSPAGACARALTAAHRHTSIAITTRRVRDIGPLDVRHQRGRCLARAHFS